jgi:hypothetical protein
MWALPAKYGNSRLIGYKRMLKKRSFFWMGILLLLVVAGILTYTRIMKAHQSAARDTARFVMGADSLYRDYQADEKSADKKYLGKVLEVSGTLSDIQHTGTGQVWILSVPGAPGGINCSIFPGGDQATPQKGQQVTVKGRCTGFLMDVNLTDCVMIR